MTPAIYARRKKFIAMSHKTGPDINTKFTFFALSYFGSLNLG